MVSLAGWVYGCPNGHVAVIRRQNRTDPALKYFCMSCRMAFRPDQLKDRRLKDA